MDSVRFAIASALFLAAAVVMAADDAHLLDDRLQGGWTARDGACRFPDAVCRGERLTSLSLSAVLLNTNIHVVAANI